MHIKVMTDPQAYLRASAPRDTGAVNTDLARQLITGKLSAEAQASDTSRVRL